MKQEIISNKEYQDLIIERWRQTRRQRPQNAPESSFIPLQDNTPPPKTIKSKKYTKNRLTKPK